MNEIFITDCTLSFSNSALSFKEKLNVAKRLSSIGIDTIEFSSAKDKTDEVLIKTVCTCVNKSEISYSAKFDVKDIEKGCSLISLSKKKRINISIPVSPALMEYQVGKKPKVVLEQLKECLSLATANCEKVELTLVDATRAENDFICKVLETALSFGVKDITISDISGVMLPSEFADFIDKLKDSVVGLNSVNLGVSVSDGFGMGVATVLTSLLHGVSTVKTSVFGKDLPSLSALSDAFNGIALKYGFTCKVDKTGISRVINQIAKLGEKSGPQEEDGEVVKLKDKMTARELSKTAEKLGYDISAEDMKKVYDEYLRLSGKKEVNTKELEVIIATTALQVPETYSLVSFSVNSSNVLTATASITLKKGDKTVSGLSYGNGAVDAAFLAVENITGRHFELDDFELGAVTEGKEAMGQAIVKLRNNGIVYSGRGVSTDIVGASIRAYVSALNKIVYEESER